MSKFKVGDRVYDVRKGLCTIAVINTDCGSTYPIMTTAGDGFTLDGRWDRRDANPTLLTAEEARAKGYDVPKIKRKGTKEVKIWVNIYPDGEVGNNHPTKEEADKHASIDRIACVKLTGTYEVEEEV